MVKILLLDGHYPHSIAIARELFRIEGAVIIGSGAVADSCLSRSRYVSNFCVTPLPSACGYAKALERLILAERPDVVVPVGYESFRTVLIGSVNLPESTKVLGPTYQVFTRAASKVETYRAAERCDVRFPKQLASIEKGIALGVPHEYPVFAKSSVERGGVSTALIPDRESFLSFDWHSLGGDAIVQEYIHADEFTYGFNGFFVEGIPLVSSQHVELRSVPRRGGSATRIREFSDAGLARASERLMRELKWTGVAQVEFKRSTAGEWVLMEVNPKFWASYAHTSATGANIAYSAVQWELEGIKPEAPRSLREGKGLEMVFPIRELSFAVRTGSMREVLKSAGLMALRPARPDFRLRDLPAYLPSSLYRYSFGILGAKRRW